MQASQTLDFELTFVLDFCFLDAVFARVPGLSTTQWVEIVAIGARRGNGNDLVVKRPDSTTVTIEETAVLAPKHATPNAQDDLPGLTLSDLQDSLLQIKQRCRRL